MQNNSVINIPVRVIKSNGTSRVSLEAQSKIRSGSRAEITRNIYRTHRRSRDSCRAWSWTRSKARELNLRGVNSFTKEKESRNKRTKGIARSPELRGSRVANISTKTSSDYACRNDATKAA